MNWRRYSFPVFFLYFYIVHFYASTTNPDEQVLEMKVSRGRGRLRMAWWWCALFYFRQTAPINILTNNHRLQLVVMCKQFSDFSQYVFAVDRVAIKLLPQILCGNFLHLLLHVVIIFFTDVINVKNVGLPKT